MATHEYVIKIQNETSGKKSPIAGSNNSGSSKSEKAQATVGQERAQSALKAIVAYNKFIAPFVDSAVERELGTIELRTGASELQQRVNFGRSIAKQVGGLATSVIAGYAVGNLPGAIIGGLISVATTAMNYSNRQNVLNLNRNLEDITISGRNIRAGGSISTFKSSRETVQ